MGLEGIFASEFDSALRTLSIKKKVKKRCGKRFRRTSPLPKKGEGEG